MPKPSTLVRMPPSAPAQLRASMRRLGVVDGARLWGVPSGQALRVAAGLPARPEVVAAVLARHAALANAAAGEPVHRRKGGA